MDNRSDETSGSEDTTSDSGDDVSDSEDDDKENNFIEFEFDIDELKNQENKFCLKCNKKYSMMHNLGVCKSCLYDLGITKTNAKKTYNLTEKDLNNVDYYSYKNYYHGYTYIYFLKEIRLLAIKKRFDIENPTIDLYVNCINTILDETTVREKESRVRSQKIKETKERKAEEKRLEREARKKYLKKKLKKKNLELRPDSGICNSYLDGEDVDIKKIYDYESGYQHRERKLKRALAERGLEIRNDSYYCQKYLEKEKFTLEEVVEMMEIMNFFISKTNYFAITKKYLDNEYKDAKEYGYWDGQRINLSEHQKENAKQEAFAKYISNHSLSEIPTSVLNKYLIGDKKCDYCRHAIGYVLELKNNILCNHCGFLKHEKNKIRLLLCDPKCHVLDWEFIKCTREKNNGEIEMMFCLDDDNCKLCDKCDNSVAIFCGKMLK